MKTYNYRSGFTLLELLGLIAIIAILALLTLPTFFSRPDEYRSLSWSERRAQEMFEILKEAQKIDYCAEDCPRNSRGVDIQPIESEEDIARSITLNPKFKPEPLLAPGPGNMNLWMMHPTNFPIKLR